MSACIAGWGGDTLSGALVQESHLRYYNDRIILTSIMITILTMMMKQYDWNILMNMMIMRKYDMIIWMKICWLWGRTVMLIKKFVCHRVWWWWKRMIVIFWWIWWLGTSTSTSTSTSWWWWKSHRVAALSGAVCVWDDANLEHDFDD